VGGGENQRIMLHDKT